jgi:hypothetical protein
MSRRGRCLNVGQGQVITEARLTDYGGRMAMRAYFFAAINYDTIIHYGDGSDGLPGVLWLMRHGGCNEPES